MYFCNILIMYADAAAHVLRRVLEQFGSWTQWEQHCNGDFLPSDEVDRRVSAYLTRLRCNHVISVAWDSNIVAPTMLAGRRLLLRGPYRDGRVQSVSSSASVLFLTVCSLGRQRRDPHLQVLDHEIGTHFVRKFNGKLQAKTAGKPKYPLQMRLETEEVIVHRQPYYNICTRSAHRSIRVWPVSIQFLRNVMYRYRALLQPLFAPTPHPFQAFHRRRRVELSCGVGCAAHGLHRTAPIPASVRRQQRQGDARLTDETALARLSATVHLTATKH